MPMDMDFAFFDWLKGYTKGLYGGAAAASVAGGMCMAAPPLFYLGMRNPEFAFATAETINDMFNDSMPAMTPIGQAYGIYKGLGE